MAKVHIFLNINAYFTDIFSQKSILFSFGKLLYRTFIPHTIQSETPHI